jgi:hypothetical protein
VTNHQSCGCVHLPAQFRFISFHFEWLAPVTPRLLVTLTLSFSIGLPSREGPGSSSRAWGLAAGFPEIMR